MQRALRSGETNRFGIAGWPAVLGMVAGAALMMSVGCGKPKETIRIDGSSTVLPVSSGIMELYQASHPGARVAVGQSGTGGGMEKFSRGEIDICDASRGIKESEAAACQEKGISFIELPVAYDGLAVVVSKDNDWCDSLTVEQLKQLWEPGSKIQKWSDLDSSWPEEQIVLYGPGVDSGTFDYFTKEIVGEEKASRSDYHPSENDNELVIGIQNNKYALGYFGYAYYIANAESLKLLGVDAGSGPVQPTTETVATNTYKPLSRPLFIYVRTNGIGGTELAEFVEFYLENAAEAAAKVGYVQVEDAVKAENLTKLKDAVK